MNDNENKNAGVILEEKNVSELAEESAKESFTPDESTDLETTVQRSNGTDASPEPVLKKEKKKKGAEDKDKDKDKRHYDFLYFFELALKSMANNIGMALASLCVLTSCLVVLGSCFLLLVNINVNLDNLGELNQIVVYCEYEATNEDVIALGDKLNELQNTVAITRVSKEESLEDLVNEYHSYSEIFSEIFEGSDNPLSDSYIVEYDDNKYVGELVYKISALDGVRKVNNRADLSIKIENFKNGITFVFIAFFVLLLVTGFYVVVNTIKMALHYRRYDIIVMKYIGATNAFVLTPFLLEGMIIGVLASSLAYIIQYFAYVNIVNATEKALGSMITLIGMRDYGWIIWLVFLFIGLLCGLLGSLASIRKNLKA